MSLNELTHTGFDLTLLVFLPFIGAFLLFFVPKERIKTAWGLSLLFAALAFVHSLCILRRFDVAEGGMQFSERLEWLPSIGANYVLGVDGISIWLLVLTTFLSLLVVFAGISIKERFRSYMGSMLFLETAMLGAFVALDGVVFYVFWELMLVPMYFIIGVWGGKRRLYASMKFVLFTAFGSLLMLVAMVYLGILHQQQFGAPSFYLGDWINLQIPLGSSLVLFTAFALAFSIKIPLFPFHTWLPDAHVEAPTGGSVILAGVLLKLGIYGLIRFAVPVFPEAFEMAAPVFAVLGVAGIVYGALVAWVQTDIKKLIAYSSVSHLGFCVLGFAAMSLQGLQGSILQMINHGISTGALFFIVGVLYERKHTRMIVDYGGLAAKVPLFAFVYLVFTLSSIGLPLTNGFVGEFLLILAGFKYHWVFGLIAVSGVILGAMYMLSLYRRVIYGEFDEKKNGDLLDLNWREKVIFAPLLALVFVIGLYPQPFLERMKASSELTISYVQKAKHQKPAPVRSDKLIVAGLANENKGGE